VGLGVGEEYPLVSQKQKIFHYYQMNSNEADYTGYIILIAVDILDKKK
jgi:hypothetical protein